MKTWNPPEELHSDSYGTYSKIADVHGVFVYWNSEPLRPTVMDYIISSLRRGSGNMELGSDGWFIHPRDHFSDMGIKDKYPAEVERTIMDYIKTHRKLRS